jgi:hypothetical protein
MSIEDTKQLEVQSRMKSPSVLTSFNNNVLKSKLITEIATFTNLIEIKELNYKGNATSNLSITILTNNTIKHTFVFNYHCELLKLTHKSTEKKVNALNSMGESAMITVLNVIRVAKEIQNYYID